jgi:DNA-binding CsgD family transcriptional regulator
MTRSAAVAKTEQEVVRLCHSSLDAAGVQNQVLRSLRRLMPVDAAFFATADPETLLFTGASVEEPLDGVTAMFLANEFTGADVNRFSSLAASSTHVATLDDATHGDRPSSARSRDILRPLGLGDELRAALVTGFQCWGYLCLHRDARPSGFTSSEAALIARLGPHIAHALRQAILLHQHTSVGETAVPGVIVLSGDLNVVAITAEASHLLSLIEGGRSTNLPLPMAIYTVAAALSSVEDGTVGPHGLPSTRVQGADGRWLRVSASRLREPADENRIAVVVETIEARATVPLLLSAYGLSAREAEVARLVLRGASTRAIADALHISQHTVQDHLKAVFDKTGVHSRRELVGQLLAQSTG